MTASDLEKNLRKALQEVPVGHKLVLNFNGEPNTVDVKMTFKGGWQVTQTIFPGRAFELIKGEDGFLTDMSITITPFQGVKPVK